MTHPYHPPASPHPQVQRLLTSTTFEIAGYRVVQTLGLVRGITVRSPNVIQGFTASIRTVFGGEISEFTQVCEETREQAYNNMIAHALAMGANAVVGVRYDASTLGQTTEVLCYGTAVVVGPST
ncbi:MAG: hypothetical protein RLY21_1517 [Planctomycetota bacterium]|jgi:uncharacterized protein YbjQ (UPF0145 family)